MYIGALAGNFDVAELALALFGLGFGGLVVYFAAGKQPRRVSVAG